jgi:hypothetical protein
MATSSCSLSDPALPAANEADLRHVQALLSLALPEGSKILATCGASKGQTLYVGSEELKWTDDSITQGSFVFVRRQDGTHDYIFKDAMSDAVSTVADGGEVRKTSSGDDENMTIVVSYGNGVSETCNFTRGLDKQRLVLWTSNKPESMIPAKVSAFVARCL